MSSLLGNINRFTNIIIDNIENLNDILREENFVKYFFTLKNKMFFEDMMDVDNDNYDIENEIKNFYNNKVKIYTKYNVHYDINTRRLHLYDDIITSAVVRYKYVDDYQISLTNSGSIYITIPPTYFHHV